MTTTITVLFAIDCSENWLDLDKKYPFNGCYNEHTEPYPRGTKLKTMIKQANEAGWQLVDGKWLCPYHINFHRENSHE